MEYTRMHGTQNRFIIIDATEEELRNPAITAVELCREENVDGMILVMFSEKAEADFRMRIFNPDGSEAEMCGNGIRCFARYVHDRSMTKKKSFNVETKAGIIVPEMVSENMVKVDMGKPVLGRTGETISAGGYSLEITEVSMGNPHCVIFTDSITDQLVLGIGPEIEKHEMFPDRTNVEFVEVVNDKELNIRVWERGAGETMACGTGACAAVAAAVTAGEAGRNTDITVHLRGGDLVINWDSSSGHIMMTGNAEYIK